MRDRCGIGEIIGAEKRKGSWYLFLPMVVYEGARWKEGGEGWAQRDLFSLTLGLGDLDLALVLTISGDEGSACGNRFIQTLPPHAVGDAKDTGIGAVWKHKDAEGVMEKVVTAVDLSWLLSVRSNKIREPRPDLRLARR